MAIDLEPDPLATELAARTTTFVREVVIPVETAHDGVPSEEIRTFLQKSAKKAAPKPIEVPPAKDVASAKEVPLAKEVPPAQIADLPAADGGEAKSATPEKRVDSPPTSNPTSASDAGTTPQQSATAPAATRPVLEFDRSSLLLA